MMSSILKKLHKSTEMSYGAGFSLRFDLAPLKIFETGQQNLNLESTPNKTKSYKKTHNVHEMNDTNSQIKCTKTSLLILREIK